MPDEKPVRRRGRGVQLSVVAVLLGALLGSSVLPPDALRVVQQAVAVAAGLSESR